MNPRSTPNHDFLPKWQHAIRCTGIEDASLGPPNGRIKASPKADKIPATLWSSRNDAIRGLQTSKWRPNGVQADKVTSKGLPFRPHVDAFFEIFAELLPTVSQGCFWHQMLRPKRPSGHYKPLNVCENDFRNLDILPRITTTIDQLLFGNPHRSRSCKPHYSGPLHMIHLGMVTFSLSDKLYHMMIRRRNNKSIYIYIYIYIHIYIYIYIS